MNFEKEEEDNNVYSYIEKGETLLNDNKNDDALNLLNKWKSICFKSYSLLTKSQKTNTGTNGALSCRLLKKNGPRSMAKL